MTGQNPFDTILENKVKFGRYQMITYFFMAFTTFSDGSEIVSLSILVPILQKEWNISDTQQGLLGTVLFTGIFLGSLLSGLVSDRFGRRQALLYATLVQFIVGVISALISNIALFILVRGIFGLLIGFTVPLAPSMGSELTPIEYRGRGVVAINFFFSLGKLYGVIVAKFCLISLTEGNWRAMLIWSSLPSLIVWYGTWRYIKESPRFLVAAGRIHEGVEVLNHIAKENNPDTVKPISEAEKRALAEWSTKTFGDIKVEDMKSTLNVLFSEKMKKITTLLWTIWFSLNFAFYGMIFILPIMLSALDNASNSDGTSGLDGLLYTIMGELPSSVLALYIIEKEMFGRKGTILYSQAVGCVVFLLSFIGPTSYLVPMFTIARFFLKLSFAIIYPLTIELYPTSSRTSGFGFASGFGRLGASVGPQGLLWLFNAGIMVPAFGFAVACAIQAVAAYLLPYDTRGRRLDVTEENEKHIPLNEIEDEEDNRGYH